MIPEPLKEPIAFFKQAATKFGDDNGSRHAAALAYYSLISFFPLLLVLVAAVGFALSMGLPAAANARDQVISQISAALPTARPLLEESFRETARSSGITGLIGLLTGMWAASNIFAQLDKSFDVIFGVKGENVPLRQKVLIRLRAVLIVLLLALMLIASVLVDAVLNTAQNLVTDVAGSTMAAAALNQGISLLLTVLIFTLLYRYLPNGQVTWRAALVGGLFTAVTWAIGRQLLGWWLGSREVPTAGAVVGAVLAFVALIYYFALILLFGGEVTTLYQKRLTAVPLEPDEPEAAPVPSQGRHHPVTFLTGLVAGIGLAVVTLPALLVRQVRRWLG